MQIQFGILKESALKLVGVFLDLVFLTLAEVREMAHMSKVSEYLLQAQKT